MKKTAKLETMGLWIWSAVLLTALSGCDTMVKESADGPWLGISPGSTMTLNRTVRIPPGRTRVFFRNGSTARTSGGYRPTCALEVRRLDDQRPQAIAPGDFVITRIQNYWTEVAARSSQPLLQFADYGDGGYSMIQTGYHFWLDDAADPNLMRLTCLGVLDDPAYAYPPTLTEIRSALGEWISLRLIAKPLD